jgi:hypothetical protein
MESSKLQTPFAFTLTVKADGEKVVTDYCIAHLRERGYAVTPPNENWELMKNFLKRLGISAMHFNRCMKIPHRPDVLVYPSATRVMEILSNPAFDAFVKRHKKPDRSKNKS